jgi:predicted P-loop ATPase
MAKKKKDSAATGEGGEKEHKKNWREVYASVEDIKTFLSNHIYLRHNVITGRIECRVPAKDLFEPGIDPFETKQVDKWQPISDRIVNSLWTAMSRDKPVRAQDIFRVIESDFVPDYHPFRYYLEHLPNWDGETDHILGMSLSVRVKGDVEEQMLFASYLKKWLVGMVAAWIDPNVVNNVILVLIGEQGSYKTTWFNYLLPPELKDYFYTKTNANRMGRDDLLTLAQYALVCCEELDTMKPAELNQLKAAVTMPSIDERAAYAHFHEHRQHIASFCGTGNNVQFLSDETGNRRWLPFEIERITSPREMPFDYQGIYSQAYALYQEGFQYWFSREEIQQLSQHNATFETPRTAHELISRYLRKPKEGEPSEFLSATDILQLVGSNPVLKLTTNKIGRAMTDLGFERMRTGSERGYIVVQYSAEEIKARQRMKACDARPETAGQDDANDTNDAFL